MDGDDDVASGDDEPDGDAAASVVSLDNTSSTAVFSPVRVDVSSLPVSVQAVLPDLGIVQSTVTCYDALRIDFGTGLAVRINHCVPPSERDWISRSTWSATAESMVRWAFSRWVVYFMVCVRACACVRACLCVFLDTVSSAPP